ncbi:MAG TPA: TetR/AcrR family transcriptional regulator [Myxococcaceae bacterium]|nr:TetR/AcrR family transcriptional regulator [Myxococcaceae bacterium]
MPRPRYERAAPELKTAILAAARKEIARAGYEGASLNRILEEAGLSKGAFYYYFDDKDDLVATVLLDQYRPASELIEALTQPKTVKAFWAAMEKVNRRQLDAMESSRESMDVVSNIGRATLTNKALAEKILPVFAPFIGAFLDFLRKGQKLGAVRKDLSAEVLLAVASGIKEGVGRTLLPAQGTLSTGQLEHFTRVVWDLLKRAIRAEER